MKQIIKKEVLACVKLIPHIVTVIIFWELAKWLFQM